MLYGLLINIKLQVFEILTEEIDLEYYFSFAIVIDIFETARQIFKRIVFLFWTKISLKSNIYRYGNNFSDLVF